VPETIQNTESVYQAVVWFCALLASSCQTTINEHPEKQAYKVHGQHHHTVNSIRSASSTAYHIYVLQTHRLHLQYFGFH